MKGAANGIATKTPKRSSIISFILLNHIIRAPVVISPTPDMQDMVMTERLNQQWCRSQMC